MSLAGWGTVTRILASVGIISACGGNTLARDVWAEGPPETATEGGGAWLPDWTGPGILSPETGDAGAPFLSSSSEVWLGQAERQLTFPLETRDAGASSPERILLIVQRTPEGIRGTITFGTGAPPPPPEGPDVLYPTGRVAAVEWLWWVAAPMDGFTYSLCSVHINAERVSVAFSPAELWQAWCAEQTPYEHAGGGYACTPPGAEQSDAYAHPVKADFCEREHICQCDRTRCNANPAFAQTIDFVADQDLLAGEMGGNTQSIHGLRPVAIRLRRQK